MQIELKSIQERTGKTFLFVTHDQEEALTMSDVIVVMNEGRIEQIGDPATLYDRPRSRFVANFIGETNLLACRLAAVDERRARSTGAARRSAPTVGETPAVARRRGQRRDPAGGDPAHGRSAPPTAPRCPGRITRRIFKGNHTSLSIDLGEGRHLEALVDPARLAGLAGDAVWVGWNDDSAVVIAD